MKVIERFEIYIKKKGLSLTSIDTQLGLSSGYMSKQIKAKASIGSEILSKILQKYHDLNPVWLLTGGEEMLLTDAKAFDNKIVQGNKMMIEMQKQLIAGKEAEVWLLNERIRKLEKQIKDLGHEPVE